MNAPSPTGPGGVRRLAPWLLLSACSPEPTPEPVSDRPEVEDTGVLPSPEAVWSPAEARQAFTDAGLMGFPNPDTMRHTFDEFLSHGDSNCPGPGTNLGGNTLEGCMAETGWWFMGIGGYSPYSEEDEDGVWYGLFQMGDMEIRGPADERLAVGGHWYHRIQDRGEQLRWRGTFTGSWRHDQSLAPWLAAGASGWFDYGGEVELSLPEGDDTGDTGDRGEGKPEVLSTSAWVDGGYGAGALRMAFEDVHFGVEGCGSQPTGALSVLDPSGYWWRLDFGETCDPCGPLTFAGQPVEEQGCVDMTELSRPVLGMVMF